MGGKCVLFSLEPQKHQCVALKSANTIKYFIYRKSNSAALDIQDCTFSDISLLIKLMFGASS